MDPKKPIATKYELIQQGRETLTIGYSSYDFREKNCRKNFIRNVYSILTAQMLIILLMIWCVSVSETLVNLMKGNVVPFVILLVIMIAFIIFLTCYEIFRYKSPINFVLLVAFTVCAGFFMGTMAATFATKGAAMAVGITAFCCFATACSTFQSKINFTGLNNLFSLGAFFVFLTVVFVVSLPEKLYPMSLVALIGSLIFLVHIFLDSQMMMDGKRIFLISPEEHIFAVLTFYSNLPRIVTLNLLDCKRRRSSH